MRDNMDRELEEILQSLLEKLLARYEDRIEPERLIDTIDQVATERFSKDEDLWSILWLDNKFDLIKKLQHVEYGTPGFGSIVVPLEGFSENDAVHNLVLRWLEERGVNVVNVGLVEARLRSALHPEMKTF